MSLLVCTLESKCFEELENIFKNRCGRNLKRIDWFELFIDIFEKKHFSRLRSCGGGVFLRQQGSLCPPADDDDSCFANESREANRFHMLVTILN
jgi:hypothetical protein